MSRCRLPARGADKKSVVRLIVITSFCCVVYGSYYLSLRNGIDGLRETGMQRMEVYVTSLNSALEKYNFLPKTLELNNDVIGMLNAPLDQQRVATVNHTLEQINAQAKSNVIYILDLNGVTLASSNWNKPRSFVGIDLAFRPYVQAALHHVPAQFYAIGTISNEAGYYFAQGIYHNEKMIGVATVKVSLDQLEKTWVQGGDKVVLADENNVIFLSSVPALKYQTLGSLPTSISSHLAVTHQYDKQRLAALQLTDVQSFSDGTQIVSLHQPGQQSHFSVLSGMYLLSQTKLMTEPNWRLIFLSDLSKVQKSARAASAFTAVAIGFLLLLILYFRQRQLAVKQSLSAKEVLQRAYEQLEVMVQERTFALNATTQELTQEVAMHYKAQMTLQKTQDELIQSSKMAVLGQMSAGITHELNQPLTALRTMSDNAQVLLDRGNTAEVRKNLIIISEIVDRMGAITRQLKVFARKSPRQLMSVSIRQSIVNALFLVVRRIALEQVRLIQQIPEEDVIALGDANRLEQVLVNLFNNGLDAMTHSDVRCLTVHAYSQSGRVFILVGDTGAGIADEAAQRLFEPFFTTKAQGLGLGLGLVISAQIVGEFGGKLSGRNASRGGAVFTVELAADPVNH